MDQSVLDQLIKLLVALVIGAIIGIEREYRTKSAGFRTVILITVGSTLFTIISNLMSNDARVASNIVTGIGFLGAGAIFKEGTTIKGLTTATTIWISAAIGMAIGVGQYEFAFFSVLIVMLVLIGFSWLPTYIEKINTEREYSITINEIHISYLEELETLFNTSKVKYKCVKQRKFPTEIQLVYLVKASHKHHQKLVHQLYHTKKVLSFEA